MKSACLAILNYNGIHHLEHLLPTVEEAIINYSGLCRAIVLDNCSTKGDVEWVRSHFPSIETISAPTNDYLFSYNWLLPQLEEEIVVLLNNDLRLSPNFLSPLVQHFEHDDVFAVSATSLDWEGKVYTCGPSRLTHRHGWYQWNYDPQRQEQCHTFFASGGFSAVDRWKFLELGGFNKLFHPAYCEDLDLCFRAWRKGWRSIFEPDSVVFHREHGSWDAQTLYSPAPLAFRGQLLFTWFSLPPAASLPERYAMYVWVLLLNLRGRQAWCLNVWIGVLLTYCTLFNQYSWMKATPVELKRIEQYLCEPIPIAMKA
ncbi:MULTISPECIES: glycosyltransferase [unclassified Moorena]|uniref:glycosyltransferase n=1 Tax=unclassified Moorena TaxID=2683338 RepID=UPI0013B64308|nr:MULTISPECIES: glycosyltransferase [unclassified Moorena]NEP31278.1 glycosyltransferase [Moorena sp. SIO3B2]NEQ11313.1 glycosyltransferase [Moorena sp. SIO4E2]NEQ13175.1 glycosyltransferase [Moorena sp. SIO3E2]NES40573.1 glycosyltransferase [Moorena sp. SIO2C4]